MEESELKQEFKISDKRRFTSEGEKREDEQTEAATSQEETIEDRDRSTAEKDETKPGSEAETDQQQQAPPPMDFSAFILSMANTALFQLGMIKFSEGEQPKKDLPAARQTIDLLSLLEEKTRGNLTDQEKKLLSDTLFQLRMAFVEASK